MTTIRRPASGITGWPIGIYLHGKAKINIIMREIIMPWSLIPMIISIWERHSDRPRHTLRWPKRMRGKRVPITIQRSIRPIVCANTDWTHRLIGNWRRPILGEERKSCNLFGTSAVANSVSRSCTGLSIFAARQERRLYTHTVKPVITNWRRMMRPIRWISRSPNGESIRRM